MVNKFDSSNSGAFPSDQTPYVGSSAEGSIPTLNPSLPCFQECIVGYLQSDDNDPSYLQATRASLFDSFPHLQPHIQLIKSLPESNLKNNHVNALYVLAGIKPVLVVEGYYSSEEAAPIEEWSKHFPHLKWVQNTRRDHLLVNEHPLPEFDPRIFIENFDQTYTDIATIAAEAFVSQNQLTSDKLLSYLLGFGPSWEAYAGINKMRYLTHHTALTIFSDEHYLQLGKALHAFNPGSSKTAASREACIQAGQQFSINAPNHPWPKFQPFQIPIEQQKIEKLYMQHMIDRISFHTDYIQTGMKYRQRLLRLLDIP